MLRTLPETLAKDGKRAADDAFFDVAGRTIYTQILIDDKSPKLTMMTGGDPKNVFDFGDEIKLRAKEVVESLPEKVLVAAGQAMASRGQ